MLFEQEVVISASTVEEAVILGLTRLGLTREAAEIEVLDEGSKGFLGLGMREARVRVKERALPAPVASAPVLETPQVQALPATPRVGSKLTPGSAVEQGSSLEKLTLETPSVKKTAVEKPEAASPQTEKPVVLKPAPEKPVPERVAPPVTPGPQAARFATAVPLANREEIERITLEVAEHFFGALELQVSVEWREEDRQALWVSVRGKDADVLVGPQAQTLDSIQYLLRTVVRHQAQGDYDLILDADGYRERRLRSLATLACNMADKAVQQGKAIQLRPMPPGDRRVIHMTLRSDARVRTQSTGNGRARAVTVIPEDLVEK